MAANDTRASTGSTTIDTITIPTSSITAWTIGPSESENIEPTAFTSAVTRVTRSPFWRRW